MESLVKGLTPDAEPAVEQTSATPAPAPEKKERTEKTWIFIKIILTVIASLGIIAGSFYFQLFQKYGLPFWATAIIVITVAIGAFIVIGLAINFIIPTKNKNFAYSAIAGILIVTLMICFFNEYREDYFDVKTGEVSVWITNDLKEYWFEKPSFDYSPKTGKEIRLATREEAEQLKKVKYDKVAKAVPLEQKPTNVTFNQPGLFNFKLKPFQTNGTWLYVPEGLRYSLSTLNDDEQPFVIRYQRGDIIEVRRKNVKIPDRAGPFQIQALEKEISVNLMVSRHK